jgi:uncharacterized membrane protein YfcA
MFMIQGPVQRHLKSAEAARTGGSHWLSLALLAQLAVAIYGGYFGAGMSIMNLSILGLLGLTDILQMNAMTSLVSLFINGIAGVLFAANGLVDWSFVMAMAVGALAGGFGAVGVARRIGKPAIRRFIIGVGVALVVAMAFRALAR